MNISNEMWRKFKNLKQEILNLKQIKKANCASAYYEFEIPMLSTYYSNWRIYYKAGSQPIVAEVISDAACALSSPLNDTQILFTFSHWSSTIKILSTREIDHVEGLN